MENDKLKQFLIPILLILLIVLGIFFLGSQLWNNFGAYRSAQDDFRTKQNTVTEKTNLLEELQSQEQAEVAQEKASQESGKPFYKPVMEGMDTEAAIAGECNQYNVARLKMEMIANYVNYDNFLKELYKHEHFLDIQSVEIVPYKKNKKILLISFNLKVYAKK